MTTPRLQAIEPQLAELSPEEMRELAAELNHRAGPPEYLAKPVDWERFRGVIKNGPDPLEYQREVRAE